MTSHSISNIATTALKLGAVLGRGANGSTLYIADLLQGQRSIQVVVLAKTPVFNFIYADPELAMQNLLQRA